MRYAHVVLVSVVLLIGRADEARACTCPSNAFDLPATGATNVPTNLREIYFSAFYSTGLVRLQAADGQRLAIEAVRTESGYGSSLFVATVPTELQPDMHYALWDEQPGASATLLEFTTGSGPDLEAPPPPRFENFHIDYLAEGGDSCGVETVRIGGYVAAPRDADIAAVGLRFEDSNGDVEERILPTSPTGTLGSDETVWFPGILGTLVCQVRLELTENETYRVDAWTIDRAGNTSDVTTQKVFVDGGGCATTRSKSLGGVIVALAFVMRRRRRA